MPSGDISSVCQFFDVGVQIKDDGRVALANILYNNRRRQWQVDDVQYWTCGDGLFSTAQNRRIFLEDSMT